MGTIIEDTGKIDSEIRIEKVGLYNSSRATFLEKTEIPEAIKTQVHIPKNSHLLLYTVANLDPNYK